MARWIQDKRFLILLAFGLGLCVPFLIGAIGDLTVYGDLKLNTSTKGIMLKYGSEEIWIYPHQWDVGVYGRTLRIPKLAYGSGTFLTTDSDGALVFMDTAAYEGDIQSVWTDTSGDVGALAAASGDTLDATSADSTVPWKVSTTAAPTTEGQAIWDSDDDILNVGDGTNTQTLGPPTIAPTSASASGVMGQMAYDSKYVYVYTQTDTWKRAALATWTDSYWLWPDGSKILWPTGDFIILP